MVRGEVGMLRREDVGVMVRQVRRERLGGAGGRLVVRLRLRGDARLVQVKRMGRWFLTEERVHSL